MGGRVLGTGGGVGVASTGVAVCRGATVGPGSGESPVQAIIAAVRTTPANRVNDRWIIQVRFV